jgi:DNA-binding NarL/FixJ family response regulator
MLDRPIVHLSAERVVQQKIKAFIHCCNRLLGQSVAHILAKKIDFRVATALPPFDCLSDELSQPNSVVILDSFRLWGDLKQRIAGAPLQGRQMRGLLIAMEDDREHFLRAVRNGVSGYVLQDASAVDVVSAIRAVAQGEAVCPPCMTRALFDYVGRLSAKARSSAVTSEKTLTRREAELVPMIGNGLTNKEIAARLNLSEETIKSHIHRILRKVGVEDRRGVFQACQTSELEV